MQTTRRTFLALGASGSLGATLASPPASAKPSRGERVARVDFGHDGISYTPSDYSALLSRLVAEQGFTADEYCRGGAVEALERDFAAALGKEAAVFLPSGTLANHLAVRTLAGPKRRVLVQDQSHLYCDTGDGAEQLSQLNLVPLGAGKSEFDWNEVAAQLERAAGGRVRTEIGAISIETPVRRASLAAVDFDTMKTLCGEARSRGIALHLDGARLHVAAAYAGRDVRDYAALFDTVYVSLWKCFHAAGGAILAGPAALLKDLYHPRRMFGGNLWGGWVYAAVAHHHLPGVERRLRAAIAVGEEVIRRLADEPRLAVRRVPNGTSLFFLTPTGVEVSTYRARVAAHGVDLPAAGGDAFGLKVNETLIGADPARIADALIRGLRG